MTLGSSREELLRGLLQKYLPERYHVATGFMSGYPRQLDVLIYDRIDHAPLFREGNLVVVDATAVRGVIEVKSVLTHGELRSALEILQSIDPDNGPPLFKGIFAYSTEMSSTSILDTIVSFYDQENEDLQTFAALSELTEIITAVCVQKNVLILSDFTDSKGIFVPSLYSVENVIGRTPHAALFFDILNRAVRRERAATGLELGTFFYSELDRGEERNVYDGPWGPYLADEDVTGKVRAEVEAIKRWRSGKRWTEPK